MSSDWETDRDREGGSWKAGGRGEGRDGGQKRTKRSEGTGKGERDR